MKINGFKRLIHNHVGDLRYRVMRALMIAASLSRWNRFVLAKYEYALVDQFKALMHSCKNNHVECGITIGEGITLMQAVSSNIIEIVRLLSDYEIGLLINGKSALMMAIERNNVQCAEMLLKEKGLVDSDGVTSLMQTKRA